MAHTRAQGTQPGQQRLCAVAVEYRGGGDQHGQQQTERVDGDMPSGPVDLLPAVVATLPGADGLGGAQRLGSLKNVISHTDRLERQRALSLAPLLVIVAVAVPLDRGLAFGSVLIAALRSGVGGLVAERSTAERTQ